MEPPPAEGTTAPGATRWSCPSKREAICYPMAVGVVFIRNCSAEAVRGDGYSRSTAPAHREAHARVSTRNATIAFPWAAISASAALGKVDARACAYRGLPYFQLKLCVAPRAW